MEQINIGVEGKNENWAEQVPEFLETLQSASKEALQESEAEKYPDEVEKQLSTDLPLLAQFIAYSANENPEELKEFAIFRIAERRIFGHSWPITIYSGEQGKKLEEEKNRIATENKSLQEIIRDDVKTSLDEILKTGHRVRHEVNGYGWLYLQQYLRRLNGDNEEVVNRRVDARTGGIGNDEWGVELGFSEENITNSENLPEHILSDRNFLFDEVRISYLERTPHTIGFAKELPHAFVKQVVSGLEKNSSIKKVTITNKFNNPDGEVLKRLKESFGKRGRELKLEGEE